MPPRGSFVAYIVDASRTYQVGGRGSLLPVAACARIARVRCPSEEELGAFAELSSESAERARLEGHIADCDDCRRLVFALAAEAPRGAPVAAEQIGRFALLELIGRGGMGSVYLARDPALARRVAIKLLEWPDRLAPGASARMRREAQALARLNHPNVVAVYEVGEHDGRPFVVMEYVEGADLKRWVALAPRSAAAIVELMVGAGRGLAAAHAAGVIHRDIKPTNILIGSDGIARLGDFGVARLDRELDADDVDTAPGGHARAAVIPPRGPASDPLPSMTGTATGVAVGTLPYMAPELLRGLRASARSDQFSFCVSLFELLVGRRPFAGTTTAQSLAAIEAGVATSDLDGVPAPAAAVLVRGLAANPARRFRSMDELLATLRPPPRRYTRAIVAAGLVIAAAATTAGLARAGEDDPCAASIAVDDPYGPVRRVLIAGAMWRHGSDEREVRGVGDALGARGQRWHAASAAVCRAPESAVRGLQADCLERQRARAANLAEILIGDTEPAPPSWSASVEQLPDPRTCLAIDAEGREPPPPDRAAAIAQIDQRIDALTNLEVSGRARRAMPELTDVVAAARATAYAPQIARALLVQARVLIATEAADPVDAILTEAARIAASAHDDRLVAEAWTQRVEVVGIYREELARAREWLPVADAALTRAGDPSDLRAQYHMFEAWIQVNAGDVAMAEHAIQRALALRAREDPPAPLALANTHNAFGRVLFRAERIPEATEHFKAALAGIRAAYGDRHPQAVNVLSNLGATYVSSDPRHAAELYRRAAEIAKDIMGGDTDLVARAIDGMGISLYSLGDYPGSLAAHREALALRRARNERRRRVAGTLCNLGRAQLALNDFAGAIASYREATEIYTATAGPNDVVTALARSALGDCYGRDSQDDAAASEYTAALAIYERGELRDAEQTHVLRVDFAWMRASRQPAFACPLFARAASGLSAPRSEPLYGLLARAGVMFCAAVDRRVDRARLADLVREAGQHAQLRDDVAGFVLYARARAHAVLGERDRARVLAQEALEHFKRYGLPNRRAEIAAWLDALR